MKILDGRKISEKILKTLSREIKSRKLLPRLDIIQVGDDYATNVYVALKKRVGESIGVEVEVGKFDETVSEETLLSTISELKDTTNGILVQLPLPKHINTKLILDSIPLDKDVDGLNSLNLKKLRDGDSTGILSATAKGIISLLKGYDISTVDRKVCLIGYSIEVGQPLEAILKQMGASVTVCNRDTGNIKDITRDSDIIIVATGTPRLVKRDWIKEGAVLIDVGISKDKDGKLVGDVDFDDVKDLVSYITPVPGGVGPMTIASLFENVVESINS